MKKLSKKNIKHFSKRYAKSKAGSTLVELVAVIAILAITSTSCLSAMFSMVNVSKRGQQISESQRICALLGEQFLLYGNTATHVESKDQLNDFLALGAYDASSNPGGLMDANNTMVPRGNYNEFFVSASPTAKDTILFERYDTTVSPHSLETITSIDKVKRIDFSIKKLHLPSVVASNVGNKYVLEYTITTTYNYTISGGVVLNNTLKSTEIVNLGGQATGTLSIVTDPTDPNSTNVLRITSTNRADVDRG